MRVRVVLIAVRVHSSTGSWLLHESSFQCFDAFFEFLMLERFLGELNDAFRGPDAVLTCALEMAH